MSHLPMGGGGGDPMGGGGLHNGGGGDGGLNGLLGGGGGGGVGGIGMMPTPLQPDATAGYGGGNGVMAGLAPGSINTTDPVGDDASSSSMVPQPLDSSGYTLTSLDTNSPMGREA